MKWLFEHYSVAEQDTKDDFDTQSGFLQLTKVTTCQILYDPVLLGWQGRSGLSRMAINVYQCPNRA